MKVLGIDPGTTQSAYVVWDGQQIFIKDIIANDLLIEILSGWGSEPIPMIIEQIRCYGMPIGQTTLDTVFWSGRFWEAWKGDKFLMPRLEVKKHLCHNGAAKDSNITQALVDRFAYGERNKGKGTKADPKFFYGFRKDIWQSFALAVTFWDRKDAEMRSGRTKNGDT